MSHVTIGIKSPLFIAAAAVIGASGLLTVAVPAQAAPSAVCTFARDTLVVNRSDGQMVTPDTQVGGTNIGPKATLFHMQQGPFTEFDREAGTASGSIKDYHISFTRGAEQYEGEVTTRGGVTGWIQGGGSGNWSSPDGSVNCTSSTNGGTATVTGDVDVYDQPDGDNGKKLGFITAGTQVNLVKGGGCDPNAFCHITGSNVPGGDGWAWGSFFKTP
jgi:hypothetical protein